MESHAQDADEREDLFVLLAQALCESFPDRLFEGVETVGEGSDPSGLVVLQKPEGRRLPVIEPSGAELGEGLFIGKAVRQPLDELHRRPDGLLSRKLLQSLEIVDLADESA